MQDIYRPGPEEDDVLKPKEPYYGPNDAVLVMDTSFLIRLANNDLWANGVWHGIKNKATSDGRMFNFFMTSDVITEYEMLLKENRHDDNGIPLLHDSLQDMIGWQLANIPVSIDPSANQVAQDAWRTYTSIKYNPESAKVRRGINKADLSVNAWARTIASQGADVYVASRDFRDVIGPLMHATENIAKDGFRITPMPPLPLKESSFEGLYYNEGNGRLSPMVNHVLMADLQIAKLHPGRATYVIFERNVKSGDVTFDVAVDIVELRNHKQASQLTRNNGKFYGIPAVRLPHKNLHGSVGILRSYFRTNPHTYRLMVVDTQGFPFFPVLIAPAGENAGWWKWYRPLQTTSDFLFHQTDSAYAKEHYRPNVHAAKKRS